MTSNKKAPDNHSAADYGRKTIHFSTLEEQEIENYRFWLSLTPEERISRASKLVEHIFPAPSRHAQKWRRIIFDRS